jgi:hypothetical protein
VIAVSNNCNSEAFYLVKHYSLLKSQNRCSFIGSTFELGGVGRFNIDPLRYYCIFSEFLFGLYKYEQFHMLYVHGLLLRYFKIKKVNSEVINLFMCYRST